MGDIRTWRRHLTCFRWKGGAVNEGFQEEVAVDLDFDKEKWKMAVGQLVHFADMSTSQGPWEPRGMSQPIPALLLCRDELELISQGPVGLHKDLFCICSS